MTVRTLFCTSRTTTSLAGTIAQLRAVPGSPLTASDDFEVIDMCAAQRGCRAQAQALVDEHWELIEAVARELLEHGQLQVCGAVAERIGLTLTGEPHMDHHSCRGNRQCATNFSQWLLNHGGGNPTT
jgi:hypothetical protein